jgi:ribonucleoside-diphosphate reductase beta chain
LVLAGYRYLREAGRRLQWDDSAIDLSADRDGLRAAPTAMRQRIELLLAGFWVAEKGVAEHLAPFVDRATGEGRSCFEQQGGDERRHARFFDRVLREVLDIEPERDARRLAGRQIVELFEATLPDTVERLAREADALPEALGLYHLVLEAIVLSIGQQTLLDDLDALASMPGCRRGVARVQADERWHVGLGVQAASETGAVSRADLEELAERGAAAWGPTVATHERRQHALAAHRRRLALLPVDAAP